jgi:small subunit ribosomal protein S20
MPIIKSAKKRVRVARKATIRNVKTKRALKTALKSVQAAIDAGKKTVDLNEAQSALDKAAKKKVMHKNKVARKQRQLAAAAKAAGIKVSAAKKSATKTATKKTTTPTKKSTAKKPAAKKTTKKKLVS